MKTSIHFFILVLFFISISQSIYSQTPIWTSTGVSGIDSHEGWLIRKNNPFELRFWKFDAQNHKITIMDGPLSNNIDYEITLSSNEYFNKDYFNVWNGDRLLKLDYNGDGTNDLIIDVYLSRRVFRVIDPTNSQTLFQLDDDTHDYEVISIYDFDEDGKYELSVRRTDLSTYLKDVLVYATDGSSTSWTDNFHEIAQKYNLKQNFPNPFNPITTIRYSLSGPENISIKIYDVSGQLVKEITKEHNHTGEYEVIWDGTNDFGRKVSSGTYFYQLTVGNYVEAKKMILLK